MSHDAKRQPAQTCAPEGIGAVARPPGAPIPDRHEDTPRCPVSACPRGPRGACGTRAETWGRSSLSPAVRLRWPPPGEHATAPGPAPPVASPRLRAGRRLWATRAHVEIGSPWHMTRHRCDRRKLSLYGLGSRRHPRTRSRFGVNSRLPLASPIVARPAMEFSLRSAPPSRPSAFPLARSD